MGICQSTELVISFPASLRISLTFSNFKTLIRFRKVSKGTDFDILHNLTGFCKHGEMLLVLGRPGAGCSTFLRVIANQRDTYKAVTGIIN
jgi:ABC-type multidrug transport system ATPase subunit